MPGTPSHIPANSTILPMLLVGFGAALVLLVWHPMCLAYPAYWDTALGCLHEATWLARHNFDFIGLTAQAPYNAGGPRVYLLTLWPALHALLLKTFGSGRAFLAVAHLINLTAAGLAIGAVWEILRRSAGTTAAWIGALALATLPLWQTQAALINMDMPTFALAYLGIAMALRNRPLPAALLLLAAESSKRSATLLALLLLGGLVLRLRRPRDGWLILAAIMPLLLHLLMSVIYRSLSNPMAGDGFGFVPGWLLERWRYRHTLTILWNRSPEAALLLALGLLGSLTWILSIWGKSKRRWIQKLWETRHEAAVPLVCIAGITAIILFCAGYHIFPPRYTLIVQPLAAIGLAGGLVQLPKWPRYGIAILVAAFFIAGQHGAFARHLSQGGIFSGQLGSMTEHLPTEHLHNDGYILERSFEFTDDLHLQMKAARELPARYPGKIFVTSWPLVHALRLPELGYVSQPAQVMTSHRPALAWDSVDSYWTFIEKNRDNYVPGDFIWIWQPNTFSRPEPDWSACTVLEEIRIGNHWMRVFRYDAWPIAQTPEKQQDETAPDHFTQ